MTSVRCPHPVARKPRPPARISTPPQLRQSSSCVSFYAAALSLSSHACITHSPPSLFYNAEVRTWDVIIIGGGIIGLSLALALRRRGASVLIVELGEPGREASYAAGGMLVDCSLETAARLQPLAIASARMYPEFAQELELDSGMHVDLRDHGTIVFPTREHVPRWTNFTLAKSLPV